MEKRSFRALGLVLGAAALWGCSSEKQARTTLAKFEHVFQVCREVTEKQQMAPGKHACSSIASAALDSTLRDTGIGEDDLRKMRDTWLEQKGYKDLYVPDERR